MAQLASKFPKWGGKRKGAGRPRKDGVVGARPQRAMYAGALKGGFRLVHYAVMGNHVHLIVEAPNRVRLARGMQGLGIRIARALNRVMGRRGRVMGDRYHAHILRTPSHAKRARFYLLRNAHHHYGHTGPDPFASHVAVVAPRTWLLRHAPS